MPCNGFHVLPDFLDELASDEDEINEDDVQYIEGLAQKVCVVPINDTVLLSVLEISQVVVWWQVGKTIYI